MAYVSDTGGGGRLGDLFAGLARDFSGLFRTEIELAKAEASEKIDQAVKAGISLAAGAILAIGALGVFLAALVSGGTALLVAWGMMEPAANFVSAIVVTVIVALIAWAVIASGLNQLKANRLGLDRTTTSLRADAATVKESL